MVFRNVDPDTLAAIVNLIGPDKAEVVAPRMDARTRHRISPGPELTPTELDPRHRRGRRSASQRATILKRITLATIAVAVLLDATIAATGTASAVTPRCGNGRCVIYLNKQETRDFGNGRAPKLPGGLPWQINVSYTALTKGHQFIARQYANRGWYSALLMSVRPWRTTATPATNADNPAVTARGFT